MSLILRLLKAIPSVQSPEVSTPDAGDEDFGSNAANNESLAAEQVSFTGGGGFVWSLQPDGSWLCTGSPDGSGVGNSYAPGDPVHDVVTQQYRDATGKEPPAVAGGGGGSVDQAAQEAIEQEAAAQGGWGEWWEDAGEAIDGAIDDARELIEDIVEEVDEAIDGITDAVRDGLADWGIGPGVDQGQEEEAPDEGFEEGTDEDVEVEETDHYAIVTDAAAYLREGPPTFARAEGSLPLDAQVHVEEIAYKSGQYKGYARVTDRETGAELGWTHEGNLTSCYDINEEWAPEEAIDLDALQLSDSEKRLAVLYNEKGGFLESESERLGITAGQAAATMMVESGGRGFSADGRMIIRFENHRFNSDWGKANPEEYKKYFKYNTTRKNEKGKVMVWLDHEWRDSEDGEWRDVHQNQSEEYDVLEFASSLGNGAEEAAAGSISMGAGQTMGRDWHEAFGYDSALEMMRDMQENPEKNIGGIFSFIENNAVAKQALEDEDYVAFATQYNGGGKADEYGADIKALVGAWDTMMAKVEAAKNAPPSTPSE